MAAWENPSHGKMSPPCSVLKNTDFAGLDICFGFVCISIRSVQDEKSEKEEEKKIISDVLRPVYI